MRTITIVPAMLLGVAVTACGGGGGDGPPPPVTTIPTGIYFGTGHFTGTQTNNGYTSSFSTSPYVLGFVTSAGNYMLLSYSTGSPNVVRNIDSGSGSALNGSFTGSNNLDSDMYPSGIPIYDNQGGTLSASFVLKADKATGQSMDGSISYAGTQNAVLSFPLGYVGGDTTPATLSAIAGTYTGAFAANINTSGYGNLPALSSTFTISSTGVLTGTVSCPLSSIGPPPAGATPCTVSGTVAARSDLNAYDVSISFADGSNSKFVSGFTGKTATGLGYYDSTSGSLMFGAIAPDNTTFAFSN